jgi:hypothetical protein
MQVIVDLLDASNYHFAEIQAGASNGTLKLFKREGGANTQLGSTVTLTGFNAGESATLTVCWSWAGGYLQANVSIAGGTFTAGELTAGHGGQYSGLGISGASGTATFDNFELRNLTELCGECVDLVECDACEDPNSLPAIVKLVVVGLADGTCSNCPTLNGTYILDFIEVFHTICSLEEGPLFGCMWSITLPSTCGDGDQDGISVFLGANGQVAGEIYIHRPGLTQVLTFLGQWPNHINGKIDCINDFPQDLRLDLVCNPLPEYCDAGSAYLLFSGL